MPPPWLSVIIPTFNGAPFLASALSSVCDQRDSDIEVIVIDDGSSDDTVTIARQFAGVLRLSVVGREHCGNWVANTNFGIALAQAPHVSILHQDDVWLPGRLSAMRRAFADHVGAALAFHPFHFIDAAGRRIGRCDPPFPKDRALVASLDLAETLLVQNLIPCSCAIFRVGALHGAAPLDEALWYAADVDLWLRLAAVGDSCYVADPLAEVRIHPASQTIRMVGRRAEMRAQQFSVLRRHLGRRGYCFGDRGALIESLARLGIGVNDALAGAFAGSISIKELCGIAFDCVRIGPRACATFLRYSRVGQRVAARLRARLR